MKTVVRNLFTSDMFVFHKQFNPNSNIAEGVAHDCGQSMHSKILLFVTYRTKRTETVS